MSVNNVGSRANFASDTSRNLSPAIWENCPISELRGNPSRGIFFYDDFTDLPLLPLLTTQIAYGKYKTFGDTGNTISKAITNTGGAANATQFVKGGFLQLALDSDNDAVILCQASPSFLMTGSTTTSERLWFEACYMQNGGVATGTGSVQGDAIPTACAAVYLGLCNVAGITLSTSLPLNDGDPITTGLYGTGFRLSETGLGAIDAVVTDGATSFTNIQAGIKTLTAWNPVKLGMFYDPFAPTAKRIRFFVDNVETTTPYTGTLLDATTNLKVSGLGMFFGATAASAGATFKGCLKWWACAQMVEK